MFGLTGTEMLFQSRNAGVSVTLTCVPPGSCERMGVDRDLDGAYDGIDGCPGVANAVQLDADGDGVGDACDGCGRGAGVAMLLPIAVLVTRRTRRRWGDTPARS